VLNLQRRRQNPRAERPLRISTAALEQIRRSVGAVAPETGGMLGGNPELGVVTHFHFDEEAARTRTTYSPDYERLNRILAEEWNPAGVRLMGFVHSHPSCVRRPSHGDEVYAARILAAVPEMERLLLPIVMTPSKNEPFEFLPFAAKRHGNGVTVDPLELLVSDEKTTDETVVRFQDLPMFARVRGAYDLDRLQRTRLVAVGCGGAAEFIELMARAGVGSFVLIDPDTVSEPNLATQQVYRRDLGRPKVECLSERIKDINPHAFVDARPASSDEISDGEFGRLWRGPSDTAMSALLCGMTDSFDAQARVNRLALQFRVPSLCAQVYAEGRGAEVTFTHPETTPACHRCVLGSRYRAFLEEGFRNRTTSDGTPIGSTSRLNATKFLVAMALLHHNTDHPRWGRMLERIGNRNLVQLRMDPDLNLPVFERVFGASDRTRVFCDEAVWLPQLPENPNTGFAACPDCGGWGHLRGVAGRIADTRVMRGQP
jgi:hypothetical protein